MVSRSKFEQTDDLPRPETLAAAKWWVGLVNTFRNQVIPPELEPGPNFTALQNAKILLTPKKIEHFGNLLIKTIDRKLHKNPDGYRVTVHVVADELLQNVMQKAKFGVAGMFAFKSLTYTNITPGKVIASSGTVYKPGEEEELSLD